MERLSHLLRPDAGGCLEHHYPVGIRQRRPDACRHQLRSVLRRRLPFNSLTLLLRTLVLLSLFSFGVKFGLMVQISDLWQFLLFLFPLLTTMQLLKLQMPKLAGLWGQLIVFMGSFISVTNPPVYDYADFLNDNLAKILGVGWRGWPSRCCVRVRMPARAAVIYASCAEGLSTSLAAGPTCAKANMSRWCTTM